MGLASTALRLVKYFLPEEELSIYTLGGFLNGWDVYLFDYQMCKGRSGESKA